MDDYYSTEEELLKEVKGIELMSLTRKDECCGFGGTFSVFEEAISVKMGKDRIQDHLDNGVEVITGADHSCLMHLDGLINRNNQPLRVMHIAEILNSCI
jgi:L-lactate dehydrogenase complex protein LldE